MDSARQRKRERRRPTAENYDLPVFQLHGERSRVVVTGRRTDDGDRCELVVITDTGGSVALYPHGATQLGVRVDEAAAVTMAQAILDGTR